MSRPRTRPEVPTEEYFRKLITRTLTSYPGVTVAMLGTHIRPYGAQWRSVLEKMVDDGTVIRTSKIVGNRGVFSYRLAEVEEEATG